MSDPHRAFAARPTTEVAASRPPLLRARALAVEHGGRAVLEVEELELRSGETLSVVGPNGAGKSTLLRVLGLLEQPTRGEIWLDGERVPRSGAELLHLRRRMAVVFQDPLLCAASVFDNAALGLRFRGVSARETRRRVEEWLDRFAIGALARRPAHTLSGGEAQRLSLARAFVLAPELLLLDEPFAALDPPSRERLLGELQALLAETRTTTVFVTHDRDEAFALGDRVAVMLGGRIAQIGAAEEVAAQPRDEAVARFVGVETILPGRAAAAAEGMTVVDLGPCRVRAAGSARTGETVLVCLRPEDVTLIRGGGASSAENALEGRVAAVAPWGAQVRVQIDCGVPIVARLTRLSARELDLRPGQRVTAVFHADATHLIRRSSAARG